MEVFRDEFGAGLINWTETGDGSWVTEPAAYTTDYPATGASGDPVANSDGCAGECVLTLAAPIDLTPYTTANLRFLRFVGSLLDAGEFLQVEVFDGVGWVQLAYWTDGMGDTGGWLAENFSLTPYLGVTNFQIRFRTKQSSTLEHVMVDDVVVEVEQTIGCTTAADCNDGKDCTADQCNAGTCANPNHMAGIVCSDRPVTGGGVTGGYCDGLGSCVQCTDAAQCPNDNNLCTGPPVCSGNVCGFGPPPNCDDGQFCNGAETCDSARGCLAGIAPDVDDGVPCTKDECIEATDTIEHIPDDMACDDGLECTNDVCNVATDCKHSVAFGKACAAGGYCDSQAQCVECIDDTHCVSPDKCINNACVCQPMTCEQTGVQCGEFTDTICGTGTIDCTDRCPAGQSCNMQGGLDMGVCVDQCTDNKKQDNEDGRDCGGFCPTPCTESLCTDGLDEDGDGFIDCADIDCIEAGQCDRCEARRLGRIDWPFDENGAADATATSLNISLDSSACADAAGPYNFAIGGPISSYDFDASDPAYAPFIDCLLTLWENSDPSSAALATVRMVVDTGLAVTSAELPVRDLLQADMNRARLDRLRLTVTHASKNALNDQIRLDFHWEAIGHHDTQSDCLACQPFDSSALSRDFCTEGCRCDIGMGGCGQDSDCKRGLVCLPRGSAFGYALSDFSVCVPAHCDNGVKDESETGIDCGGGNCGACPDCALEVGCSPSCPCENYEGPCTRDEDCQGTSTCGQDIGARFGQPETPNLCWPGTCEPDFCGSQACGPCADCVYQVTECDATGGVKVERLSFGSASMRDSVASFVNTGGLVELVAPHVLRTRAGSDGPLSLFEGARTNYATLSSQPSTWPATNLQTASSNPALPPFLNSTGLDLLLDSRRLESAGTPPNQYLQRQLVVPGADSQPLIATAWLARASSASQTGSIVLKLTDSGGIPRDDFGTFLPLDGYQRFEHRAAPGIDSNVEVYFALGEWNTTSTLKGYDLDLAMPQVELGAFPSSYVPTLGTPATRDLDRVVLDPAALPAWFFEGRFAFEFAPIFSSADVADVAERFVFFELGNADHWLGLESNGLGAVRASLHLGAQEWSVVLPSFGREQSLRFELDGPAGRLAVDATSTTSASFELPRSTVSVGARGTGDQAHAAFAWLGQPHRSVALPLSCSLRSYPDGSPCGQGASACEVGQCMLSAKCGDGNVDRDGIAAPIEACDDGNNFDGDGCSASCTTEAVSITSADLALIEPDFSVHALGADGAGRLLFAWQSMEGGNSRLLGRRATASGVFPDSEQSPLDLAVLEDGNSDLVLGYPSDPQVAGLDAGGWVVSWTDHRLDREPARVLYRLVAADGSLGPIQTAFDADDEAIHQSSPRLTAMRGGFVLLWVDERQVLSGENEHSLRARLFDSAGIALGQPFAVTQDASSGTLQPTVSAAGPFWYALWARLDDGSVRGRRFEGASPVEGEQLIASDGHSPSVSVLPTPASPPDHALAWIDRPSRSVHAMELFGADIPDPLQAFSVTGTDAEDIPEVRPSIAAFGDDAILVAYGMADGYRDADFRVLSRDGRLYSGQPDEEKLHSLLTGPSNQRDVHTLTVDRGVWLSWADDGMSPQNPEALPNGLRAYLLGCPDCDVVWGPSCYASQEKIVPPEADLVPEVSNQAFTGMSMALDGTRLLVGVPGDVVSSTGEPGWVLAYEHDGRQWVQTQKLTFEGAQSYIIGTGIAIDGDRAVVGAPMSNLGGTLHVLTHDGNQWVETDVIPPDPLKAPNLFGAAVDLRGDTLVASSFTESDGGDAESGSVYTYRHDGSSWVLSQRLDNPAPLTQVRFGEQVVLDPARGQLLVSATGILNEYAGRLSSPGIIYIYEQDAGGLWTLRETLQSPDVGSTKDTFGFSVRLDGDRLLVTETGPEDADPSLWGSGDPSWPSTANIGLGQAHFYEHDGTSWQLVDSLLSPPDYRVFGFGADLRGDLAVIASVGEWVDVPTSTPVAIYRRAPDTGRWTLVEDLRGYGGDRAGMVAVPKITADELLLGAPFTPEEGYNIVPGAIFSFDCQPSEGCGDGFLVAGEQCDDGDRITGGCEGMGTDGQCEVCDASCNLVRPLCGNNMPDPGEGCDDGNTVTEYCTVGCPIQVCGSDCQLAQSPYCGDGVVEPFVEQCDDGNAINGDGCDSDCTTPCTVLAATDTTCDGIDDDCNGIVDDGYLPVTTACGSGVCASNGSTQCIAGTVTDTCVESAPTATDDAICDGINSDCDLATDEDYPTGATTCGVGVCQRSGTSSCTGGVETVACTPGTATGDDSLCNLIDEDCDGLYDEAYPYTPSTCGLGACQRSGEMLCVAGTEQNQCVPGAPLANDDSICDGIDQDCDGMIDEDCCQAVTATLAEHEAAGRATRVDESCGGGGAGGDLFFDNFSAGLVQWVETGGGNWVTESAVTTTDYPSTGASGNPIANSDACSSGCVLTLATPLDLTAYTTANLELLRFVGSYLDAGEYLRIEAFNGVGWDQLAYWTNGQGNTSSWFAESYDLTPYVGVNNFQIRFSTMQSSTIEHVMLDDVRITAGSGCVQPTWYATGSGELLGTDQNLSATLHQDPPSSGIWYTGACGSCGNGIVESGEACDDGNNLVEYCGTAGCQTCGADCQLVTGGSCGDGIVQPGLLDDASELKLEPTSLADDRFGSSLAADADRMIVGAPHDLVSGVTEGAVYFFDRDASGWTEIQKLRGDGLGSGDRKLGSSVDLSGNVAIAGAPAYSASLANQGRVYLYRYNGAIWKQETAFGAPTAELNGSFGNHVAIDGNYALVQSFEDRAGTTVGVVHVYQYNGSVWGWLQTLEDEVLLNHRGFGAAIELQGDLAVISAQSADTGVADAVHVYRLTGGYFLREQSLSSADALADDDFGAAIAVQGTHIIVGAPNTDVVADKSDLSVQAAHVTGEPNEGAAYVFVHNGSSYAEVQRLIVADTVWSSQFGASLGLDQELLVVGAPQAAVTVPAPISPIAATAGKLYAYRWNATAGRYESGPTLEASDATGVDGLGAALDVAGGDILAGAPLADAAGPSAVGAVYDYRCVRGQGCGEAGAWSGPEQCDGGTGCQADCTLPCPVDCPWGCIDVAGRQVCNGATQLTAGSTNTCALRVDGSVACWGSSGATPYTVGGLPPATAISKGKYDLLALQANGDVYYWDWSSTPALVLSGASGISAGGTSRCVMIADGAQCWGSNTDGKLGVGDYSGRSAPTAVVGVGGAPELTGVVDLAGGDRHFCALLAPNGEVACWGSNDSGQLGNDLVSSSPEPVMVPGESGVGTLAGAVQLTVGVAHSCALMNDQRVLCWGGASKLGSGTNAASPSPVQVLNLVGATQLAAGLGHTCAVHEHGQVACWGLPQYGATGVDWNDLYYPALNVPGLADAVEVTAATWHSCARRENGQVLCWGTDWSEQLGNGAKPPDSTPEPVNGLSDAVAIDGIREHICARLSSGEVVCWGRNDEGQLGDGSSASRSVPVRAAVATSPVSDIATTDKGTYAALPDGTVHAWGLHAAGRGPEAIQLSGISDAIAISGGHRHGCAIEDISSDVYTGAGPVRCFGDNSDGQLGNGLIGSSGYPPVDAIGMSNAVATTGSAHSCAIDSTGGLSCWGKNHRGQVGIGTTVDTATPTAVTLPAPVVDVDVDYSKTCAVLSDGRVACWGWYGNNGLGTGSTDSSTPVVADVALISDAVSIGVGYRHACAVRSTGAVACWSSNGTAGLPTVPVDMPGITDAVDVIAGWGYACALHASGQVSCWGPDNGYGQLGRGYVYNGQPPTVVLPPQ
ncbi:MAG: hypothetical protein OEZ06_10530 [Myxococcales bacterium]|nr:hypothetical protein [Myxococcales bacterium]